MSNSRPCSSSDHGKGENLCHDDVPSEDESFFETPPDVIFLPASQPSPTSPQSDRAAGCSKHVPEMVEMLSQSQCTVATGILLPSPVTAGASPAIPIDTDAKAGGTPQGGTGGGQKRGIQLTPRKKAAKRRTHPPILVSPSTSSRETTSETQPVGEGDESVVTPKATPAPTNPGEGGGEPTSPTSDPVTGKTELPSSSVTPPPRSSTGGTQGLSPNEQRDDARPAAFSSHNRIDADWPHQHPIPASLEELVRLYASRRQRLGNQNVADVLTSKQTCLSR